MAGVISLGKTKEAALYFDRVLPTDIFISILDQKEVVSLGSSNQVIPVDGFDPNSPILQSLLFRSNKDKYDFARHEQLYASEFVLEFAIESCRIPETEESLQTLLGSVRDALKDENLGIPKKPDPKPLEAAFLAIKERRLELLACLGFQNAPHWADFKYSGILEALRIGKDAQSSCNDFVMSLSGLNIVDASQASWDQICEFREDKQAFADLRALRLFFQENFEGKDPEFVSDKLLEIEQAHISAAKLWGFDTAIQSMSVVFSQGSFVAGSGAAIAATVAGTSLSGAAIAGLAVPIGGGALEFGRAVINRKRDRSNNPTRYLTRLRNLSEEVD